MTPVWSQPDEIDGNALRLLPDEAVALRAASDATGRETWFVQVGFVPKSDLVAYLEVD